MNGSMRPAFGGFVKEGLVIFAGVLVALVADDFRTNRAEIEDARESLRIIAEDLRRDSFAIADARESAAQHEAAMRWAFENRDNPTPDPDSVAALVGTIENNAIIPAFSRAGYDGLRAENRLDLIADGQLRRRLSRYYEVLQPDNADYSRIVYERREGLLTAWSPHIEFKSFLADGENPREVGLRGPWSDLTSDAPVMARISRYGGSAWASRRDLGDLLNQVEALLGLVRATLDDEGVNAPSDGV